MAIEETTALSRTVPSLWSIAIIVLVAHTDVAIPPRRRVSATKGMVELLVKLLVLAVKPVSTVLAMVSAAPPLGSANVTKELSVRIALEFALEAWQPPAATMANVTLSMESALVTLLKYWDFTLEVIVVSVHRNTTGRIVRHTALAPMEW